MVDRQYPLHPQEDVETPPQAPAYQAQTEAEYYQNQQFQAQPAQAEAYQQQTQAQPQANPAPMSQNLSQPEESNLFPGYMKPQGEQLIVEWRAMSRPFKHRSRQYFTTVALLVGLISAILFFAGQMIPIAVVIAVGFLAYVLSVVPPAEVTHSLTTFGLRVEGTLYYWEELGRFWFESKYGQSMVNIEVGRFPGRLTLLLGDITEDQMNAVLSEVLLNQEPVPSLFDKAVKWVQEKIPLESETAS